MKRRTFKVIEWKDAPPEPWENWYPMDCMCGHEAFVPVGDLQGRLIIAGGGMGWIFDIPGPPERPYAPDVIECRRCGRQYGNMHNSEMDILKTKEEANVR